MAQYKIFGFIKQVLVVAMKFSDFSPSNVNSLACVSMKNQECKIRSKIIDVSTDEGLFYPSSIEVNKGSRSSMIHMLNCVFQMLLKTKMSKFSI